MACLEKFSQVVKSTFKYFVRYLPGGYFFIKLYCLHVLYPFLNVSISFFLFFFSSSDEKTSKPDAKDDKGKEIGF